MIDKSDPGPTYAEIETENRLNRNIIHGLRRELEAVKEAHERTAHELHFFMKRTHDLEVEAMFRGSSDVRPIIFLAAGFTAGVLVMTLLFWLTS